MSKHRAIYFGWKGNQTSEQIESIIRGRYDVVFSKSFEFKEQFDQSTLSSLRADYLFSFGPQILRPVLLNSVQLASINFHTAPPAWPGRGSCSFALFEGDSDYGVTAHLIDEGIDSGPILKVIRFPIQEQDTARSLNLRALSFLPVLVREVIDDIEANGGDVKLSGDKWQRKALKRSDLLALLKIELDDSPELVNRKIRACAHPDKPGPFIEYCGKRFWYTGE